MGRWPKSVLNTGRSWRHKARRSRGNNEAEAIVARHTVIQSWVAVATLAFGAVTTGLLIYLSFAQHHLSKRQIDLEFAKVEPKFAVSVAAGSFKSDSPLSKSFPIGVVVKSVRGDASIEDMDVAQDIIIERINRKTGKTVASCILRMHNYYIANLANELSVSPPARWFIEHPPMVMAGVDFSDFYIYSFGETLAKLTYRDLWGKAHKVVFTGSGKLGQVPMIDFPPSGDIEVVDARFADEGESLLFQAPSAPIRSKQCQDILFLPRLMPEPRINNSEVSR